MISFIREREYTSNKYQRRLYKEIGRDWSDGSVNQESPRIASINSVLGKGFGELLP